MNRLSLLPQVFAPLFATLIILGLSPPPAGAKNPPREIAVLPSAFALDGPEARQALLVLNVRGGAPAGEVADAVDWTSSDPSVVVVEDGVALPRGDGTATLTARLDGLPDDGEGEKVNASRATASAEVTVRGLEAGEPFRWSFRNHVLPVMTKAGCNAGGCHGALAGKGGFRLSLRAYDPASDHYRITREARGRRVELGAPARSLLLTKPTTAVSHKGERRIVPGSRDYRVLSEWIAQGAAPPREDDPALERIEVLPALSVLAPGATQRLVVRAFYSDGREEDVTAWTKFTSARDAVARVDEDGVVTVAGPGEGAVTAWFSSRVVIAGVTVPFPNVVPESAFAAAPRRNFIDDRVLDQLRRLNLKPSPRAGDATFLRRAFLDTVGVLPTPEEARAFLADEQPDKRDRLIEALLARPEFVDYWAFRWSDLLLVSGRQLRPEAVKAYYQWVRGQVADNVPWDVMVRRVVAATGGSLENGATNFFAVHQDPETMAENVSQAFLSLSINCARCHNHPLEKWTNDQYYAFANLFSRVRAKGWGGEPRNGDGVRTIYVEPAGDLIQPRTGKPQPAAPLDAAPVPDDYPGDRRAYLADWLTSPGNPAFARAVTNRVWANFFGVGLVEPVDDLRASNPASNEALLAAAAAHLVENGFDLKALMRTILRSETYQRSAGALPENRGEKRFYSRYYPRRLMAEVLHDAVAQVTAVPTAFDQVAFPGGDFQKTDFYPLGTRAVQLYDSAVASYFLNTFGRNERAITCECERSNEPSMVQVLHISNGDTLNHKLAAEKGRVRALLAAGTPDEKLVEEAYFLCLSRPPTEREKWTYVGMLAATPGDQKQEAAEDLFWALMSSREFLFQH